MKISLNYDIYIGNKLNYSTYIKEVYKNKKIYIITDKIVSSLFIDDLLGNLKMYDTNVVEIVSNEDNKTLSTYNYIIEKLIALNITRDSLIIGFGGGVVGDIASFVASTILRGVMYVSVPTTLLSQVDSSIGGKTGLNFNGKKNIIGSFYEPNLVLIDTYFLTTLNKDEFNNALGEVIKCGLIKDKEILSLLQGNFVIEEIIYKCLIVKKYYVENDLRDLNQRMILNFGHTFGHVIEMEKNKKHGFAVIDGMIMIIKYGINLGITNKCILDSLLSILECLNIEYDEFDYNEYFLKLKSDKKRNENSLNFIFLKNINEPIIKEIENENYSK